MSALPPGLLLTSRQASFTMAKPWASPLIASVIPRSTGISAFRFGSSPTLKCSFHTCYRSRMPRYSPLRIVENVIHRQYFRFDKLLVGPGARRLRVLRQDGDPDQQRDAAARDRDQGADLRQPGLQVRACISMTRNTPRLIIITLELVVIEYM